MTSIFSRVFLGLIALCAVGCDLSELGKPAKPVARPSEPDRAEEVAAIPSTAPTEPAPPSAKVTTPQAPSTSAANPMPSPIPTRDPKTTQKKDEPAALAPIDTRTIEGTVRAIDVQRRLISINVRGEKSQTFPVDPKAPIENLADASHALKGGLAAIRPGAGVFVVVYRNKNDKEVVSLIRVKGMTK